MISDPVPVLGLADMLGPASAALCISTSEEVVAVCAGASRVLEEAAACVRGVKQCSGYC